MAVFTCLLQAHTDLPAASGRSEMPTGTKESSGDFTARGRDFKIGDRSTQKKPTISCYSLGHFLVEPQFMHGLFFYQYCADAKCGCGRVVVASTGKRSAQQLTGVDGDVIGLDGNGWVIVRTSDGSETLRIQQRYLSKQIKEYEYEVHSTQTHLIHFAQCSIAL